MKAAITAVGRDADRLAELPALGANATVTLGDDRLGTIAREADVVLDFIWGEGAERCIEAILAERAHRHMPLTWIHIGSMAREIARGTFRVDAQPIPLNEVGRYWSPPEPGSARIVFTP